MGTGEIKTIETQDQNKGEGDGGSRFKLAARGRQGLKSKYVGREHMLGDVLSAVLGSSEIFRRCQMDNVGRKRSKKDAREKQRKIPS